MTSAGDFSKWFQSEDNETFEDLVEICRDDDIMQDIFNDGLKKLQKGGFLESTQHCCDAANTTMVRAPFPVPAATHIADKKWGQASRSSVGALLSSCYRGSWLHRRAICYCCLVC